VGFCKFGIIRNEQDLRRCHSLVAEFAPETQVPNFNAPLAATLVGFDGETDQVEGLTHVVNIPEMRVLLANPGYKYCGFLPTVLYNMMETNLRTRGFDHYFVNIPESAEKVIKELEKFGATRVDPFADRQKIVRLLKRL
jgi:hypothetical protein